MKRISGQRHRSRFWVPRPLELGIGVVLAVVWLIAIVVVIRHEDAGWMLSVVYVLLGIVGLAVSWLIVWPLLRFLVQAVENE